MSRLLVCRADLELSGPAQGAPPAAQFWGSACPVSRTFLKSECAKLHFLSWRPAASGGHHGALQSFTCAAFCTECLALHPALQHNHKVLYTAALKLTYGPPERRLTVESRMLCAPGNAWEKLPAPALRKPMFCFNKDVVTGPVLCNTTHMTVAIPAFPGTLMAVAVEDETIPMDQLQDKGITLNTTGGVNLLVSRGVLKSAVS